MRISKQTALKPNEGEIAEGNPLTTTGMRSSVPFGGIGIEAEFRMFELL